MAPNKEPGAPSGDGKKRKGGPEKLSARSDKFQQKRIERNVARAIPAQPAEAALKDGELDLQAFVAAHEFEIRSLEQSMATSKASGTSRAFQKVPRGLRRRTASHNPKRVPKRLRARAMNEAKEDNTPIVESRKRKPRTTRARLRGETAKRLRAVVARKQKKLQEAKASGSAEGNEKIISEVVKRNSRPKLRTNLLNDPPKPPSRFRKRQMDKTWLPTHAWHAKRARMTEPKKPLWRFAIPITSNEKIYRPVHRMQGDKGAVVWDMSYMSTISLSGNPVAIERVLKHVGVSQEAYWNERGRKWRVGTRSWSGQISRQTKDGRRPICPAIIVWNPAVPELTSDEHPKKHKREVLLRLHPSAFLETFNELLRLAKMETPHLAVVDLRYEIGSIDVTGPASTETLLAILAPRSGKKQPNPKHAELFKSLDTITNPASLPLNAVLGFDVQDPRLRFPPKRITDSEGEEGETAEEREFRVLETLASWPAEENLQSYGLFDRDQRHKGSCLPSEKLIHKRRSASAPGTVLKPLVEDPSIPILLLASRSGLGAQSQGTWTLLAPWKSIMAFWPSFVRYPLSTGGNPRFAGLLETQQVAYERGMPWFPADHITTNAGAEWELEQRRLRTKKWQQRPSSKRTEWESLDLGAGRKGEVGDGLVCDFEYLFGLSKSQEEHGATESKEDDDAMDLDRQQETEKPVKTAESVPLYQLNPVSKELYTQLIKSQDPPPVPKNGLLSVRLHLPKGVANTCARIYRLPRKPETTPPSPNAEVPATDPLPAHRGTSRLPLNLREQWLARASPRQAETKTKMKKSTDLETRKRLLAKELTAPVPTDLSANPNTLDIHGHPLVPDADNLIGFVTSGAFSLSEGRGVALASIAVANVLDDVKSNPKEGMLCIVRNAGVAVGRIARWEAV